jgi:hypothetical protein
MTDLAAAVIPNEELDLAKRNRQARQRFVDRGKLLC